MTSPPVAGARGSASFVLPLYALTLFMSAFLLFAVQPMFTKMVLPLLGGSAAVWNTACVFFQGTLLLGYLYAHLSTRYLGHRAQTIVHGCVLALGFVALPIGVASGWTPPTEGAQIPWLIGLLAASIGLPFFAVSATAPLLQRWFAHTDHASAGDPYFLYGGSNLGSLAALLSYPLLVEPTLGLHAQGSSWTFGYALLAAAIATCGAILWKRYRAEEANTAPSEEQGLVKDVTWRLRLHWLALSVVPSALLLGVTLHIGTDIAAVPMLWVLPLALYLLTFVLVFARRPWCSQKWMLRGQVVFVVLVTVLYPSPVPNPILLVPLHFGALFFTAMVCHGELARRRPVARHLTEFYLWMSIGGVVGGILASIVAPLVFHDVFEYPLALFLALLLRPAPAKAGWIERLVGERAGPIAARATRWTVDLALPALVLWLGTRGGVDEGNHWRNWVAARLGNVLDAFPSLEPHTLPRAELAPIVFALTAALVFACLSVRPARFALAFLAVMRFTAPEVFGSPEYRLLRERSFFGVYSVHAIATPVGQFHFLLNGATNHGGQNLDRPLGPTLYYTREGPVGQFFEAIKGAPAAEGRIGVIGLGVGAMACYAARDQRITYYEIDPLDERIARDERYFTYLSNCGKHLDVVIGDGRLSLAKEPDGTLGILVVAAFSGDAIPAHLLTREAFALYFQKLAPNGFLLLNITNAFMDLMPVVGNLAADAGLFARFSRGFLPTITPFGTPSDWVVVARKENALARFAYATQPWLPLAPDPGMRLWTDDFTNIVEALRWEAYGLTRQ
jgi:hypothetical protein